MNMRFSSSGNAMQSRTVKLVIAGLFSAIIFVLTVFVGSAIKIGSLNLCVVLIPIILGGIFAGPTVGAVLGFVFGTCVLFTDPMAQLLLAENAFAAFLGTCVRCALAGWVPAIVYKLMTNKSKSKSRNNFALILASVLGPAVNTSVFALSMILFFKDWFSANFAGDISASNQTATVFILAMAFSVNFFVELISSVILCPVIAAPILSAGKRHSKKETALNVDYNLDNADSAKKADNGTDTEVKSEESKNEASEPCEGHESGEEK